MKNTIFLLAITLVVGFAFAQDSPGNASAQPTSGTQQAAPNAPFQFSSGTVIPAELSKPLDAKKLKVGDKIEARTATDMLSNGKIVMPRESKILGHVTAVKAHSKESPDSMLGIAFERVVMKDGREMPLQASLQAIGAPLNPFAGSSASPIGAGDMQPAGNPMGGASSGGSMGGGQRSSSPSPSYPSGGMPTSPDVSPHSSSAGALSASSQGVVGLKDLSLSATPEASVVSSSNKNVHLDGGTQMILRVQ